MSRDADNKSDTEPKALVALIEERERTLCEKIITGCRTTWQSNKYCTGCKNYNYVTNVRTDDCNLKNSSSWDPVIDNKRGINLIVRGIVDSEQEYSTLV